MRRALLLGLVIGTFVFFSLLGAAFLGFSPALELAFFFSFPAIHIVGPLFSLFAAEQLDGPPGGVTILLFSAWAELSLVVALLCVAFTKLRSNPSFKRDRREAAAP